MLDEYVLFYFIPFYSGWDKLLLLCDCVRAGVRARACERLNIFMPVDVVLLLFACVS